MVVLLALAAAGCGSSSATSVASIATTTSAGAAAATTGSGAAKPSASAFATCMSSHGFEAAVGSAGNAPSNGIKVAGVTINGNADPASPQFQAAMQACRKLLPGGGPPSLSPAEQAETAKALAKFASCMRKHGVSDFPDPNGQGLFPRGSLAKLNVNAPLFQSANNACQGLIAKTRMRF